MKYHFVFLFRLCQFSIIRVVLNRAIDGGDSNAIVIAVKIQVNMNSLIILLFLFN
jgi:hypothetical protein